MKAKIKTIIFILLSLTTHCIFGAIGCMDNSRRLKERPDYKDYRYVKCNCPCHKYISSFDRGKCPECGHYHDPGEFKVVMVFYREKIRPSSANTDILIKRQDETLSDLEKLNSEFRIKKNK